VTRITGNGPEELKSLAVRLREADPRLKNELRRNFRKEADPVVRKVQASILAMPVTRGVSPPGRVPLRAAIARTVTSSVRITAKGVQVDIVSLGSRMPQGEGNMAAHVNARRGWGHPVFERRGRDPVWVRQTGKPGWFTNPVSNSARDFQDGAQAAMDETKRKLEH
jgi:hypothetical protein